MICQLSLDLRYWQGIKDSGFFHKMICKESLLIKEDVLTTVTNIHFCDIKDFGKHLIASPQKMTQQFIIILKSLALVDKWIKLKPRS